jgi:hypothetical protein
VLLGSEFGEPEVEDVARDGSLHGEDVWFGLLPARSGRSPRKPGLQLQAESSPWQPSDTDCARPKGDTD